MRKRFDRPGGEAPGAKGDEDPPAPSQLTLLKLGRPESPVLACGRRSGTSEVRGGVPASVHSPVAHATSLVNEIRHLW